MEFLTIDEVASKLRVNRTTVVRWVKNGALKAIALPHVNTRTVYRIPREELDKVLNSVAA